MDQQNNTSDNPSSLKPVNLAVAAAAVVILISAWSFWPSSNDQDPGPPRLDLSLDITKGERLHDVKRGQGDQVDQVAFIIAQGSDQKIWFEGRITEVVSSVSSIHFYRRAERREMIATVRQGSSTHLLASSGEAFVLSPELNSVGKRTPLRAEAQHFAWVANDDDGAHVLFFNGATFTLGEAMSSMSSIKATEDAQTVTAEGVYKGASAYGYDTHVFSRHNGGEFARLKKLGDKSFTLMGRKPAGAWHVVVDHQVSEPFSSIKQYKQAEDVARLMYLGQRKDGWRIIVESRVKDDAKQAQHGPFDWLGSVARSPWLYDDKAPYDQFHFVAGRGENQHVGLYASGNGAELSPAFKTVTYQNQKAGGKPLYQGAKESSVAIIHGASAGADYDAISRLKLIEKGANYAYVGEKEDRLVIAHGSKPLSAVDQILVFGTTTPGEKLIAAVKTGDSMKVYHQDKFSTPVTEILGIKKLKEDRLAWKVFDGEGERVFKDHQAGQLFEMVMDLNVSPGGRLWYDGIKADQAYRVLEDKVGTPADRVTRPVFTPDDDRMVYGHMRRAADDENPDQYLERWKVVDEQGAGRAFVRTPSKKLPELAISFQPWRQGKGAAYHYVARVDSGTFVGSDRTVHGPFNGIKEPTVSNDGSKISFFAEDEAGWHLHHKGKLGAAFEQAFGLSFTVVGDHPRYTVRRGKQAATVIDDQVFHKIKGEQVNQARTVHRFAGHQDDGWHVVANMKRSAAFDGITKIAFGRDEHAVFAEVEKEGQKHLIHLAHGGDYVLGPAFDSVNMPTYYPDLVRRGEVTIKDNQVTIKPTSEDDQASDDLGKLAPETKLYVVYSFTQYQKTTRVGHRHVVSREGDTFTLNAPWSEEFLKWINSKQGTLALHTVTVPYSYSVQKEGRTRYVYDNKVYERILGYRYGESRTLYLRAKDSMERWITNTAVHGGFDKISFESFEDKTDNERYVLRVTEGKKSGYIIGDPTGLKEDFKRWDSTTEVIWEPAGGKKVRTIKWKGAENGKGFEAVGHLRYDAVEGFKRSPNLKLLWYVGKRAGRSSVNIDGTEHPWYSEIIKPKGGDRVTFKGDNDTATYHAVNSYQLESDLSIDTKNRSIHRLVVGDQETAKFHELELLQTNDRLDDTHYLARSDEGWTHYRGESAVSRTYKDIAYFQTWEAPKLDKDDQKKKKKKAKTDDPEDEAKQDAKDDEKKPEPFVTVEPRFHFIGQDDKGWVEVHDGSEGVRFRAFSSAQPTITRVKAKDLAERFKLKTIPAESKAGNNELKDIRIGYLPDTGGFIYSAKKSSDHVLVHLGRTMVQADKIEQIWSYKSGKVAATLKRGKKYQAMYETSFSPLAESVTEEWSLDGDQFVAQLKLGNEREILWSNKGQTKTFKTCSQNPESVHNDTTWQAIVTGLAGSGDGRNGDTLAVTVDQSSLVQGSDVIAVADKLEKVDGTESDAGMVVKVKLTEKTVRTTRDLIKIVALLKKQKDRLNKDPLDALEKTLAVWEDYGFANDKDGLLSDDLDTVSETNADRAFVLLNAALKVDFEKIGEEKKEGGRAKLDALLSDVRDSLKEFDPETKDRWRIMVNGEMGPIFDEIGKNFRILGTGGLSRTLYSGKREHKNGDRWYLASNDIHYGPHESIGDDQFGWAFGGVPFVVTKDGDQKTLKIADETIYEGSEIDHFVRFGERTMLGATRSSAKVLFYDGQQINQYIAASGGSKNQDRIKDQDPFLTALKIGQNYHLWSSKFRVAQATTIYEMALHEDEEFGDSTLHWIEGDLDLETETMRVLQHQLSIPRIACKALQPVEALVGNLDTNLQIPDRKEKPLVGKVGYIDEAEDKRFIFTSNEGQSFNFDRGAANTKKAKEWRAEREEWMGETVEIEWKCAYHQPDDRRARKVARAELTSMKIYEEEEPEENSGAAKEDKDAQGKKEAQSTP